MRQLPGNIGERIKHFRDTKVPTLTLEELAAKMQLRGHITITKQRIHEIERGHRKVSHDELVSFSRILSVPITVLLGVPDKPGPPDQE